LGRPDGTDVSSDLEPVHARHDHVGQQQIDGTGMALGDLDRALTARRFQHGVPGSLEDRLDRAADAAVVVDEEDGLRHAVIVDPWARSGYPAARPPRTPRPAPPPWSLRLGPGAFGGFGLVRV
jgi:hypothetical protein